VAGPGNNGGDGFAIARRLEGFGVPVSLARPLGPAKSDDARTNEAICERMGLELDAAIEAGENVLVIDALLGTGLDRPAEGAAAEAIAAMNRGGVRLAVDLPSGVSAETGEPLGPAVRADVTAAFVGLKPGMPAPSEPARGPFGVVEIVDIGVPKSLKRELSGG
jgi:NAD(P)H-hydrate epimerase